MKTIHTQSLPAFIITVGIFLSSAYGQKPSDRSLLFSPISASVVEPRVGFVIHANRNTLRLDAGNSIDLLHFDIGQVPAAFGIDFFTWTSLREDAGFHFPVDAVDYLFGLNASLEKALNEEFTVAARLRISHISAHLVDGRYNKSNGKWMNDQLPRVYSREFIEMVGAVTFIEDLRFYAGLQYVYHVDPPDLGKFNVQLGTEYHAPSGVEWLHPYAAYDFKLTKVTAYQPTHTAQIGVKVGKKEGAGVQFFLTLFDGFSEHGEYYDLRWSYWGPGVNVIF